MVNLGSCGRDPIVEIRDQAKLASIERFLQGVLGQLVFGYVGARIAPRWRVAVSVTLAMLVLVGVALGAAWVNSAATDVRIHHGWIQIV